MSGYSGTPLARKLGIKEGATIAALGDVPDGLRRAARSAPAGRPVEAVGPGSARPRHRVLHPPGRRGPAVAGADHGVGPEGTVWVAWPKRSSGVATDLTEDAFRADLLPSGWVDVKVCAIDETWSGLKFVLRKDSLR